MMFLIRFWSNLTKKDSDESAKYEIQFFSTRTYSFRTYFHGSGSRFFRIGSGLGKKVRSGYKTLVLVHTIIVLVVYNIHIVVVVVYSREGQEGGRVPSASHVGAEKNTNKI